MGYLKKIRDAKIQNGRYDRQERLDLEEESETQRRTREYDEAREEELSFDIVTGDIILTPKERLVEELKEFAEAEPLIESITIEPLDLGACGSYGERLYDEGTELCDCCELSESCFAFYKHWIKKE